MTQVGDPKLKALRGVIGPVAVIGLFALGVKYSPFEPHRPPADPSGQPAGVVSWDDGDWEVLHETVLAARAAGVDTLPMGEAMAAVGRLLLGTPYEASTLEVEGPERLVVHLQGLDCVTFVENAYAMAALVKGGAAERLDDRGAMESEYELALQRLRYRGGIIDGYGSRLHYFSEWIADNAGRNLLDDVSREIGGVRVDEPIDFMTNHADAYRQLEDPDVVEEIHSIEARLSTGPRWYVPQERIPDVAADIRTGDIIAATSTLSGLDVAHTGIAVWVDGALHLMHAPLTGGVVEVSETPLAERIARLSQQDGIMVARPSEPYSRIDSDGAN